MPLGWKFTATFYYYYYFKRSSSPSWLSYKAEGWKGPYSKALDLKIFLNGLIEKIFQRRVTLEWMSECMLYQIIQRQRREAIFYQNKGRLLCLGGTSFFQPFWKCRVLSQWELCSDKRGMWDPIILTRMPCFCLWILSTVHGNSCFGVGGWGGLFNVLNCFQVLQSPSVSMFKGQTWPHWNTSQPVTEVLTFLDKSFEPLTWWKQNPWPVWVLGFWKSPRAYHFPWLLVWSWLLNGDTQSSDGVEVRWGGTSQGTQTVAKKWPDWAAAKAVCPPWLPTSPQIISKLTRSICFVENNVGCFYGSRRLQTQQQFHPIQLFRQIWNMKQSGAFL